MALRRPLKPGSVIKMPNQGQYVICEKIGEGGLSLIYSAKTKANDYPVIIKEFFPAEHAHRAEKTLRADDGTIIEKKDRVYPDSDYDADRFGRSLSAFEQEGQLGSSARLNNFQIISFSDCGNGYAVLPLWSNDSCSFFDLVDGWRDSPPKAMDPFFTDFGRVYFALSAISSLLSALSSIHEQGMLHLDISPSNVVWAGRRITPENGVAFLTDFGCSVLRADRTGSYPAEYVLSYSKTYAAPEYTAKDGQLTQATDIYSVGRLLIFLCLGQRAFCEHYSNIKEPIGRLRIPEECRNSLLATIQQATEQEMSKRYQSAFELQEAVVELLRMIPTNPINPDCSTAFSLYSLKSMLEGSMDTHYSWAHELCARRGASITIPEFVHNPIAHIPEKRFADDIAFLCTVLPTEIFIYLQKQIANEADKQHVLNSIMNGNYSVVWKKEIGNMIKDYGAGHFFLKCKKLLKEENLFFSDLNILFQLPGLDIQYFDKCYTRCAPVIDDAPYKGLALLVIFALMGPDEFIKFAGSPSDICNMLLR